MSLVLCYITAHDHKEATTLAQKLLSEKLAACVNMMPNMISMYMWDGAIADEHETLMIVKTKQELVPELMARVKQLTTYEVPCVLVVPVLDAYKPYADWLLTNVK